jgi:DNA-binding XRE family transcriptional regulator
MSAITPLLHEAQRTLHTTQEGLGKLVGASRRTAQRWATGRSTIPSFKVHELVRHLHPHNRDLAHRMAVASGTTLLALGLERPPAGSSHARHVGDSLVCVAAEALSMAPGAVRPALLAALVRAKDMGLSLDAAEAALREPAKRG